MRKIIFLAMVLVFGALGESAQAAFWDIRPKVKTPEKAKPAQSAPSEFDANRRIQARAKEALAAKDWMVYLTPIEGKKTVMDMDVLVFSEGKFTSKGLLSKGYPISNFTITVSNNGRVDWEVVQIAENADMAVWKGELEGEVMRGVLSLHTLKGQLQDFYFTNEAKNESLMKTTETQLQNDNVVKMVTMCPQIIY